MIKYVLSHMFGDWSETCTTGKSIDELSKTALNYLKTSKIQDDEHFMIDSADEAELMPIVLISTETGITTNPQAIRKYMNYYVLSEDIL